MIRSPADRAVQTDIAALGPVVARARSDEERLERHHDPVEHHADEVARVKRSLERERVNKWLERRSRLTVYGPGTILKISPPS